MGCVERRSIRMNAARRTTAAANEPIVGADEPVHQRHHAERRGQRAGEVEVAGVPLGLLDVAGREERDDEGDRDVDEEDPAPVEPLDEHAAGDQADRAAAGRDAGEDAEGPVAFRAFVEGRGDEGEGGRRGDRAADALEGTGGEELPFALGQSAEERGESEEEHAEDEHAAAPEDVARAPSEEQEAAERERVGVDDPGQAGRGEVQRALDVRERDVHDRDVEDHHQLTGRDDEQGDALAVPALAGGGGLCRCRRLGCTHVGASGNRLVSEAVGRSVHLSTLSPARTGDQLIKRGRARPGPRSRPAPRVPARPRGVRLR